MNMEFLGRNIIQTTTSIVADTGTSADLIDRDEVVQHTMVMATTTAATATINFDFAGNNVDRIALQNTNYKNFSLSVGGSPLTMTSSINGTQTASFTNNSATSLYIDISQTAINTLTLVVSTNTAANLVHRLGQFWGSELFYTFERNPEARDYKPLDERTEFLHTMADGGTVQYLLGDYFSTRIRFKFVSFDQRDNFRTVFDKKDSISFVPHPTLTSWLGEIYEVLWVGDFRFFERSANNLEAGYSGEIRLREVPR